MKDKKAPLIRYTALFNKQRKAAPLEIKIAFREMRELFLDSFNHPYLRNHALREQFQTIEVLISLTIGEHYLKLRKVKRKQLLHFIS